MRYTAILLGCVLFDSAVPVYAEWYADVAAEVEFDDNLSRAQLDRDIKSDVALAINLTGGYYFQLTDGTGLALGADLGSVSYMQYEDLNNLSLSIATSLYHKIGLGLFAPRVRFSAAAGYYNYRHEPRDGWRYGVAVGVGKRLSERWDLQLDYQYERRKSDEEFAIPVLVERFGIGGAAYDISSHSISLSGVYTINENLAAVFSYSRYKAPVTSTTLRNGDIFAASDAITPDSAFGNNAFAYRIDAKSNVFSIDLSRALNHRSSLNLGYEYWNSHARGGLEYQTNLLCLSYLLSY